MTVQELIDALNKVEDKSMVVLQDDLEDVYTVEVTPYEVILTSL